MKIQGELEINLEDGTIYFHDTKGKTLVRLKGFPKPMPEKDFYDVLIKDSEVSWNTTKTKQVF